MVTFRKIRNYTRLSMCIIVIVFSGLLTAAGESPATYPFRIVQISDTQPVPGDEKAWKRTAESIDLVNDLKPDFVIFPGDITHSGTEDEYKRINDLLSKIEAPVHLVPGNHDTITPADEVEGSLPSEELRKKKLPLYHKYFGTDHWSFEYGNFLFVGFDCTQNWPKLSRQRRQWLMKTFLSSDKPYKFAVTHYTHSQTNDTMLEHLMTCAGVIGYLHGHNNVIAAYKDAATGRLVFSSGSGAHIDDYGVMYFDVNKDSLACFWKPVKGEARPLGLFNLEEAASAVSRRKTVLNIPPYIQQLTPTEVTIKWQTKIPSQTRLMFRKTADASWIKHILELESVLHEMKIDDLVENTQYEFSVNVNTEEFGLVKSRNLSFKTPPTESDSVTFAVYGDTRTFPLDHEKVISAMVQNVADKLDLWIHTGDLVADGLDFESWSREFFTPAQELLARVPLYPVLGNHENDSIHYFDFFNLPGNERWYSFDRGPVHFTFLDSYFSSFLPGSEQYQWLENDLANCTLNWKIVALHSPVFTSGPHGKLNDQGLPGESQIADMQTHIIPLLEKQGVTMVFSGHDHIYERSQKGSVYYIVAGGGGAPLYDTTSDQKQNPYNQVVYNKHHYCLVQATASEFNVSVYDADVEGKILDKFGLAE